MNNKTKKKSGIAVFFIFAVLLIGAAAALHILISGALPDNGKTPSGRDEASYPAASRSVDPAPGESTALPNASAAPAA